MTIFRALEVLFLGGGFVVKLPLREAKMNGILLCAVLAVDSLLVDSGVPFCHTL